MKTSFSLLAILVSSIAIVALVLLQSVFAQPGENKSNVRLETFEQKRARLESFDVEMRDELRRKKLQYDRLSDSEKKELSEFHVQLTTHPNAKQLIRIMKRYHEWLEGLDGQTQNEFLDLPTKDRIQKITQLKRKQALEAFGRVGSTQLPANDAENVFNWFEKITERKIGLIRDRVGSKPFRTEFYRRMSSESDFRMRLRSIMGGGPVAVALEIDPEYVGNLVYEDIDELQTILSFDANQILAQLNVANQKQLIVNWYAAVQEAKAEGPSDDELLRFAETLSQADRDRLYKFSPQGYKDEVLRLWKRYNQRGSESNGGRNRQN